MPGELFVVATPIGNLGDITLRAIETLRSAERLVAEDTRRARTLLTHLGIGGKPVDRLDANATERDVAQVVERLVEGVRVALVTDAGTPVVSDPGTALVRAAIAAGVRVTPIPGPSAVTAALSVSGLVETRFRFVGFLPRSGTARRDAIALVEATEEPVVLFEAPGRTAETLVDLSRAMPDREALVARELTKLHEELTRGTLAEVASSEREWIGEVTVVLGPRVARRAEALDWSDVDRRIDEALAAKRRSKDVAEQIALETGLAKRDAYARVLGRKNR